MNAQVLATCSRVAASQHGVLAAEQARAAGLSADSIQKLVRVGNWTRVRPSVYALWAPTDPRDLWRQRLMAGALWLGRSSAVSHRAAAIDWELDGIDQSPIEFSTTSRRRGSEPSLIIHRVASLPSDEIVMHKGLPVTSVPRTLVDLCAVVESLAVELALESALRKRLATIDQVQVSLTRAGATHPSRSVLRSMLARFPGVATGSALEVLVWRAVLDGDLPMPIRQYEVRDRNGRFVARVDFAYPDVRFAIEADGHTFHSSKRDWARDLARHNALTRLGWVIHRVTWDDATMRPEQVVAEIAQLLVVRSGVRYMT